MAANPAAAAVPPRAGTVSILPRAQQCALLFISLPREALETFLGFLESSSSATEQVRDTRHYELQYGYLCSVAVAAVRQLPFSQEALQTPHIDKVLHHYQQRVGKGEGGEVGSGRVGGDSSSSSACWDGGGYESRLMQLERQLAQLLQKSKVEHWL